MTREDTKRLLHDALKAIGEGGLMGAKVAAPGTLVALDQLGAFAAGATIVRRRQVLNELRRQDLIIDQSFDGVVHLQLTVRGIHRLQKMEIDTIEIPVQKPWDMHWRMVMFDIPARRKESRYLLSAGLRRLGFTMLQRSMWVHPYPCFSEVEQLVVYANLQPFVSVAEVTRLDNATTTRLLKRYPELAGYGSSVY